MSCGIICRRKFCRGGVLRHIHLAEQEPDWIDKMERGILIFLCLINLPVLIAAALLAEFVL